MVASSLAAALATVMPKPIIDTMTEMSIATSAGAPVINDPYAVTIVRSSAANNSVENFAIAGGEGGWKKTRGQRTYNIAAEMATDYWYCRVLLRCLLVREGIS